MQPSTQVLRIARKELTLFFASPAGWLFLGSFAAVTLFVFFWVEAFFARNIADVRPLFEWMPILMIFLASALTMRMWSEERRTGTLEYVLTQPVPLWRFVAGKFLACMALLLLALLITLPLPASVTQLGDLDLGPVFAGYIATLLLGAAYISVGLFVSARSDNPIVSLIGSVVLCSLLYLLGSAVFTGFFGNFGGELLRAVGSGARFEAITRGVLDVRDLFYYLSLTGIFLCLNVYALERERWANHRLEEPPQHLARAHRPADRQPAGGQPVAEPDHQPAGRRDLGPPVFHLRGHPRLPGAVAGAAAAAGLLQRQDPPPAGAPGAADARPDEGIPSGRQGQGAGGDHRPGAGARAGGGGQPEVRHPLRALSGGGPLPVRGGQLLLQRAGGVRRQPPSAGL